MSQRVLVVDDSPFVRRVLSDWIKSDPSMSVVGTAENGVQAVELARQLRPDAITLDVEMPMRDGLSALEEIMRTCPTAVLMVSSHTSQGAEATIRALELGAYDFIAKPQGSTSLKFLQSREELLAKLHAARLVRLNRPVLATSARSTMRTRTDKVVVVAASTGGPRALATLFESLPKGFSAPMVIVQHMPSGFTDSFAKRLDAIGTVPCKQANENDRITPGLALLAPGGKHLTIASDGKIVLGDEPPIHGVKPAADKMFFSAAEVYGSRCVGVVLTGMGKDGAEGALAIRSAGGEVFGESEATCVVYGMPKAALQLGATTAEYRLDEMGGAIVDALQGRLANAS